VAPLVGGHVLGLLGLSGAVHIILGWGGGIRLFQRGITAGVGMATVCMAFYEVLGGDADYGVVVHSLHLACLVGVVVGLEVHNKRRLPGSTVRTKIEKTEVSWGGEGEED